MHRPEWCRANMKPFPWILQLCAFLLLCALATTTKGSSIETSGASTRIIGGYETESLADAPHMVSLRYNKTQSHFCGGSIIGYWWILTAAHCTQDLLAKDVFAVVGILNLNTPLDEDNTFLVDKIISHELYVPLMIRNDIALMKVNRAFQKDAAYKPIRLCTDWTSENAKLRLTGWGMTSVSGGVSNTSMSMDTKAINNLSCFIRIFGQMAPPISLYKNICAENKKGQGACKGDSGGGLVDIQQDCVCGIVSWGIPCGKDKPDMYTRVSVFKSWIDDKIKKDGEVKGS